MTITRESVQSCTVRRKTFAWLAGLLLRKTREVWPLLTVETEVNGNSKYIWKGPFLVGLLGLLCRYKRFLFSLGCSSRPCPRRPASWAGSRAGSPVSYYVSSCSYSIEASVPGGRGKYNGNCSIFLCWNEVASSKFTALENTHHRYVI